MVSRTPSSSSTGAWSISRPHSTILWMSRPRISPSVSSMAVSIIERVKPFTP
jgi:hypothetical protein